MTFRPILHLGQRLSRFAQARIQRYTHLLPGEGKRQTAHTPEAPDLIWRMPEAGAAAYAPDEDSEEYDAYQEDFVSEEYEPGAPRPVPADLAAIISAHAAKREAEGTTPSASPFAGNATPALRRTADGGISQGMSAPAQSSATAPLRRAPDAGTPHGMSAPTQPSAATPLRRAPDAGTSHGMSAPAQPPVATPLRRAPDAGTSHAMSAPTQSSATPLRRALDAGTSHGMPAPAQPPADVPKPRRSRESLIAALTGAPVEAPPIQPSAPHQAADDNDVPQGQAAFEDVSQAQADFAAAPTEQEDWQGSEPTPTVAQLMRERAPQRRPSAPPPNTAPDVRTPFMASDDGEADDIAGTAWTGQVPPVQTTMPAPDVRTPFMASAHEMASDDDAADDSAPMMDLYNALLANGFAVESVDDVPDAPPVQARTVASDAPIIARKPQVETPPAVPSDQLTNSGVEAAVSTRQFKRLTAQQAQPGVGDVPADVSSSFISSNEPQPDITAGEAWTGLVPSVQTMPAPSSVQPSFLPSGEGNAAVESDMAVQRMPAPSDVHTPFMASHDSNTEIEPTEVEPTAPVIDSSLFALLGLPPDTPVQGAEIFAQRQPAPSTTSVRTPFMASHDAAPPDVRTPLTASQNTPPSDTPVENTPSRDIRSMNQATIQRDANVGTPHEVSAPASSAQSASASAPGAAPAQPADADAQGAEGGDVNVDQLARDVLNVLRDRLRIESERRSGRG